MRSPSINKEGIKVYRWQVQDMGKGIQLVRGRAVSKGHAGPVEFTVKAGHAHPNSSPQLEVRDGVPCVQWK